MKKGFTLAEVLMTLGIIGVVAALTTPALIQNTGDAKIGPRLLKAKTTFETATEMMLTKDGYTAMTAISKDPEVIGNRLRNYMKIDRIEHANKGNFSYKKYDGTEIPASDIDVSESGNYKFGIRYDSNDGVIYYISVFNISPNATPYNQSVGKVIVDINGAQGPNTVAKDTFFFTLFNDGTLKPTGGYWQDSSHWNHPDPRNQCNEKNVGNDTYCAGSIFDNGMKIIYQ